MDTLINSTKGVYVGTITKYIMLYGLLASILILICMYKIIDGDDSNIYRKILIGIMFFFMLCIGGLAYISKTYPTNHISHINNKLIVTTIEKNIIESRWSKWHCHHM